MVANDQDQVASSLGEEERGAVGGWSRGCRFCRLSALLATGRLAGRRVVTALSVFRSSLNRPFERGLHRNPAAATRYTPLQMRRTGGRISGFTLSNPVKRHQDMSPLMT